MSSARVDSASTPYAIFTLNNVRYRFIGWLGAQLESSELAPIRAGTERIILNHTFRAIYVGPRKLGMGSRRVLWTLVALSDDTSLEACCRSLYKLRGAMQSLAA